MITLISKFKWNWIKFWGHYYKVVFPDFIPKKYYLYHRKFYDIDLWDKYFINRRSDV